MDKHSIDQDVLMTRLRGILSSYLEENSRRTLNGLSKRCEVSEPTLRRILKGQVKTIPSVTTVLDVLATITGEKSSRKIAEMFPGPIGEYICAMSPHLEETDVDYNPELNLELRNPIVYLIYKLSSNQSGVTKAKVQTLFGLQGHNHLKALITKGYVVERGNRYFAASTHFSQNHDDFVSNFKAVADFVKTRFSSTKATLNPIIANYSESISPEAYKEIVAVQKASLKKIRSIMSNPENAGDIPAFMILCLDTLDQKTAWELADESTRANDDKT